MNDLSDESVRDAEKDLCLNDLYLFAKHCLGYNDLVSGTHHSIARALQDDTKRKLICVPRGCFKSTLSTIAYPMWLLEKNPNLRILIDSELYTNSKNFLREIKGHYQSNIRFRELFGEYKFPLMNESELIHPKRTKSLKEASIAVSGIGAQKTSTHWDVIIADDLSSYSNTKNPEVAKKTLDHYRLYTSLLEPNGTMVVIGTRYSEIDIIGFIIENELGIKDGNIHELKKNYCDRGIEG